MRKEWFEGRDCLDIGCNTGQVNLECPACGSNVCDIITLVSTDNHPVLRNTINLDHDSNHLGKNSVPTIMCDVVCVSLCVGDHQDSQGNVS